MIWASYCLCRMNTENKPVTMVYLHRAPSEHVDLQQTSEHQHLQTNNRVENWKLFYWYTLWITMVKGLESGTPMWRFACCPIGCCVTVITEVGTVLTTSC